MYTIAVGVPTYSLAKIEMFGCRIEFIKKKILVKRMLVTQTIIDTENCRIMFIPTNNPYKTRGLKVDESFGFAEEVQCLINKSRKPSSYKGTFLDYIYEKECK